MPGCHAESLVQQPDALRPTPCRLRRRSGSTALSTAAVCAGYVCRMMTMDVPCSAFSQRMTPSSLLARAGPTAAHAGSDGHKNQTDNRPVTCPHTRVRIVVQHAALGHQNEVLLPGLLQYGSEHTSFWV